MQTRHEKTGAAAVVFPQPLRAAHRVVGRRDDDRLQRRAEHAFDRSLPFRVDVQRVGKCADEMKVAWCFAGRKDQLDGGRVISASLVQLLQTFEPVAGARILVTHAGEFRFGIADCFVTTHDRVDRRFAFRL